MQVSGETRCRNCDEEIRLVGGKVWRHVDGYTTCRVQPATTYAQPAEPSPTQREPERCKYCLWKIKLTKAGLWKCGGASRCAKSPSMTHEPSLPPEISFATLAKHPAPIEGKSTRQVEKKVEKIVD